MSLVPFAEIENPVVLYHAHCADGFCAAWLIHRQNLGATFIAINYGEPVPEVCKGRDVLVVDFSFSRSVLGDLVDMAKNVVVLDHHKTAEAELKDLDWPRLGIRFDMEKSGARLTLEYIRPQGIKNWLVDFTEDRDLWRWKIPRSQAVNAAIGSYMKDFDVWDKMYAVGWCDLVAPGEAILRDQAQKVASGVRASWMISLCGYKVPCVNATASISETVGAMSEGQPFAVGFFENATHRIYSLRSTESGVDVSEIAAKFGGGGHKHAAGFKIPFDMGQDMLSLNERKGTDSVLERKGTNV